MIKTLEKLTSLIGVSGCEDEVREYIKTEINDFCNKIEEDKIGNLYAFKEGKNHDKTMMLCAHMDEVGFIVKSIDDNGYIKFASVGGIDSRILLGQRVVVGESKIDGVIGIKAVHMTTKEERKTPVREEDMYIDIGASSLEDAQKSVKKGDYIGFYSEFERFGENKIKAKALDDRAGCAVLIDAIKTGDFYYDTWVCFSVQEEVGLRGALVAGRKICPDIAIVVEGTICADTANAEPHQHITTMGGGATLSIMERSSRSDIELVRFIHKTAEENSILCQYKRTSSGGNDAGNLQVSGNGAKTAVISLPCRYIHSAASVADENDFDSLLKIVKIIIGKELS